MTSFLSQIRLQYDAFIHSGIPLVFWNRPSWNVDQIGDQTGKVIIVTGGNSGTGYATALALYNKGATVYLACRNESKARDAMERIKRGENYDLFSELKASTPDLSGRTATGRLEFIELDLSDLNSVNRCAEEFAKREKTLDILYANAGIMATPQGQWTKQGYSMQFGTNAIGHHRLITLLLPLLLSPDRREPARVIITTSMGHVFAPAGGVDYRSIVKSTADPTNQAPGKGEHEQGVWAEYGQSKWADIAFARYIEKHYGQHASGQHQGSLISAAVHPGSVATNLASHMSITSKILRFTPWLTSLLACTAAQGALNQLWIGTLPAETIQQQRLGGAYIVPWQTVGVARDDLTDEAVEKLWQWCDDQGKKTV